MFLFTKNVFMFSSFKKYLIQEVLAEERSENWAFSVTANKYILKINNRNTKKGVKYVQS